MVKKLPLTFYRVEMLCDLDVHFLGYCMLWKHRQLLLSKTSNGRQFRQGLCGQRM